MSKAKMVMILTLKTTQHICVTKETVVWGKSYAWSIQHYILILALNNREREILRVLTSQGLFTFSVTSELLSAKVDKFEFFFSEGSGSPWFNYDLDVEMNNIYKLVIMVLSVRHGRRISFVNTIADLIFNLCLLLTRIYMCPHWFGIERGQLASQPQQLLKSAAG